jgi:hypothetical protein
MKSSQNIPPYFAKISPELIAFKWDKFLQKAKETKFENIRDFDRILVEYDYIFDDQDMIEVIDPTNNLFYYNVYFLEYHKGEFIQRHEKLFGDITKLKQRLFNFVL